ncbi:MAG: uL22 family ribosomal protein [Candidatus Parvarchaeum sp.]
MVTKVQVKREGMPISLKHTHEIMEAVKGKQISKANSLLKKVLAKEAYIPFRKYPSKGHKHGVPAGYPQKATKQVISMLEELKANAKNMGLDESKIVISSYSLGRGGYPRFSSGTVYRHGKRTNLTIYSLVDQERKAPEKKQASTDNKVESSAAEESVKDAVDKKAQKPAEEKKEEESKQESNKSTESNDLKAEQ